MMYLDYAASSPELEVSKQAYLTYINSDFEGANPNSLHGFGRQAYTALENARRDIAKALGNKIRPHEVYFTSGGTESNNLALFGLAHAQKQKNPKKNRIIISAIEHDSVRDYAPRLKEMGFSVDFLLPQPSGRIAPEDLDKLIDDDVCLVSVMYANNETGIIQPIKDIAQIAHAHGAYMHTDAVQAFCHIPLDLSDVDAVSITAHKIGGPVGIGALVIRSAVQLTPLMFGGGQENAKRPGTQNVCGAMCFAAAASYRQAHLDEHRKEIFKLSDKLYTTLCSQDGYAIRPTSSLAYDFDKRLPGTVSILCPNIDGQDFVLQLDSMGYAVSAASACASGSTDPSHVLQAMKISRNDALGHIRISFDERTNMQDIDTFCNDFLRIMQERYA